MGEPFPPGWFVVAASILVVGWLLFELWLRTASPTEVEVTDRRERGSSEGSSYQAQVSIPSSHRIEHRWVWVSHTQFQALEESPVISVHLREFGERTFVRSGRHQSLVWLLAFISIYLVSELISQVFDS